MLTASEHMKLTGHLRYDWSLERDLRLAEAFFGRAPHEDDPVISVLVCAACDTEVINR